MTHRHKKNSHPISPAQGKEHQPLHNPAIQDTSAQSKRPKLEIVLKCDSAGSVEAISASILKISPPDVDINIIYSGVGDIHKSDILMAETGSRLIVGFQVGVPSGVDKELKEHGVEARMYEVIYKLTNDLRSIAESMIPLVSQEEIILGSAKVIALFKSSRKGIIIGCEVLDGHLSVGQHFRIISAMGPVYSGTIESMHIEDNIVQKVTRGQKVGIKIRDFNRARVGDIVESYRPSSPKKTQVWRPEGRAVKIS
jgi:translation initiation factor IF-2